jgi:hypothetical protein
MFDETAHTNAANGCLLNYRGSLPGIEWDFTIPLDDRTGSATHLDTVLAATADEAWSWPFYSFQITSNEQIVV